MAANRREQPEPEKAGLDLRPERAGIDAGCRAERRLGHRVAHLARPKAPRVAEEVLEGEAVSVVVPSSPSAMSSKAS
jgi:hypothetical protein